MKGFQVNLSSLLLWSAALPIWLFLTAIVLDSPGFGGGPTRFVLAPLVLVGMTAAIHRLLRDRRNAWALSALLAAVLALGSLYLAASMSG